MKKLHALSHLAVITLVCGLSSGCASIVDGSTQSVSVDTPSVTGATCSLTNNKGEWYINSTPGSVSVHRSYENLVVVCQKPGYDTATDNVKSSTKGMAAGNILFGGVIGAGVDCADGAAYDYPTNIHVPMQPAQQ
jgi:hypothetical protein